MNPYSFIPFLSFLTNLILAAVVLTLNPKSKTNRAFCIFTSCFALWAFVNFLEWNCHSSSSLALLARIEPLCWLPATILQVEFIYSLVKKQRDKLYYSTVGITVVWSLIATTTGCLLVGYKHTSWGQLVIVAPLYYVAVAMCVTPCIIMALESLITALKKSKDTQFQAQLRYLITGTFITFVLVILECVFRTSLFKIDKVPFLGSFFIIIQSGFVFFTIVRYRFLSLDIRDAASDIFSQIHEGVIIVDRNQVVTEINASAQAFFCISSKESITSLEQLFGISYRFEENYENLEITIMTNGKQKVGFLSQSNLVDKESVIGKLVIVHDITLRREEEQKRVQLEAEIHQSHSSRLEALGMLAGGIAHDFNNMLSGVTGYATLLKMKVQSLDEKMVSYVDKIIISAMRASELTKKLLSFARRNVAQKSAFNLHTVIGDALSLLEHSLDKRITIQTDLQAPHMTIDGDRTQVQNMLLNIAINAGDAMPEGGLLHIATMNKTLSLDDVIAHNKDACSGEYVVASIKDTGTGMSEEIKLKIFDPFFTTKGPGKGTGLGLASSYGVVRSHNGFITVDTKLGAGTTFHAFLPVIPNREIAEVEKTEIVMHGQGTILLVDDEEIVRTSAAEMLTMLGYKVISQVNGEFAISWYKENMQNMDLAILDIMMPVMSGAQCAEVLRQINPNVKIMFMSGYASESPIEKIEELKKATGPIGFIAKPFTIEELSSVVKLAMRSNL